ncbi:MarR family transcriptional regulator [Paenibacillus sp. HB172176]|uniref:MarR family winged helix-turn-helix transcriptional regulator n=1 Tax=Paenibacillus sp. HB172176 TaxID=2493690 RepID=UPI001438B6B3|nr:MarR family transcriptional regulator [Paenibacillus sp. HB172176]
MLNGGNEQLMTEHENRYKLMRLLDESFREVRKQIHAEWNRYNVHGLGMTHAKMLIILAEEGEQNVSYMAERLSITNGGVTGISDRLIDLGYMIRDRSSADRRVVLLRLTEEGRTVVENIRQVRKSVMMKLYRGMSLEHMQLALELFNLMSENLRQEQEEAQQEEH